METFQAKLPGEIWSPLNSGEISGDSEIKVDQD